MMASAQEMPGLLMFWILVVMLVILGASVFAFVHLVRRYTLLRVRNERREWARGRGYSLVEPPGPLPYPLSEAQSHVAEIIEHLHASRTDLLRLRSDTLPAHPTEPVEWRVLIRRVESDWPVTALRPVSHPRSVVDLFDLSSYPSLGGVERFVVFGTRGSAAQLLSRSKARGLLPPDVGLLLHGQTMVLDFSSRPFDPLEFDRMLALCDQLVLLLPAYEGSAGA